MNVLFCIRDQSTRARLISGRRESIETVLDMYVSGLPFNHHIDELTAYMENIMP